MGVTFELEHVIPLSRGGATIVDNLCLACPTCNRHKATRVTAVDPSTHKRVTLFHPLRDSWAVHFKWSPDTTELIGLTPIGRATIEALHMNRPAIIELRRYWAAVGHHPPE